MVPTGTDLVYARERALEKNGRAETEEGLKTTSTRRARERVCGGELVLRMSPFPTLPDAPDLEDIA